MSYLEATKLNLIVKDFTANGTIAEVIELEILQVLRTVEHCKFCGALQVFRIKHIIAHKHSNLSGESRLISIILGKSSQAAQH